MIDARTALITAALLVLPVATGQQPAPRGDDPYVESLNLDFEAGPTPERWFAGGEGYAAAIDTAVKHSGAQSLRIAFERTGAFGVATGRFPVDDARGRRLRLAGYVKTDAVSKGWAGLWMRVDGPEGVLAFDNMQTRGITGTTGWTAHEVVLEVPEEAVNINFGALLTGEGTAWIDSLEFELLDPAPPPARVTVRGIVRDASGNPVEGAHVALVRALVSDRAEGRARTGRDGRFAIEVLAGEYGITATTPGRGAAYVEPAAFGPDTDESEIAIGLKPGGVTLRGEVLDDAGNPVAGVALRVLRLSQDVADIFYTETDGRGRYAVSLIAGDGFFLDVDSEDYIAERRHVEGGDDGSVDLTVVRRGPAPDDVVAWIRKHAIPLVSPEAGHGFEDMQRLRGLIGDARVVGLGEATHGTREFFQLKHRMLEFLVEEMGFTVFAIEANWPESLAIDRYVRLGEGDPKDGLDGIYFWTWNTEEVLALIEWMRSYNEHAQHETKLRFYGFDMQTPRVAAAEAVAYLSRVDPERGAILDGLLGPMRERNAPQAFAGLSENERGELFAGIDAALESLDRRREAYVAASGDREWVLGRQQLVIVKQAATLYASGSGFNARDEAMAANIEWILDTEPPGTKVVVWAHNGHVSRRGGAGMQPMGANLRASLGDDYVVIGFAFHQGAFQAIDWTEGQGKPGGLREHAVGPAPPENVGAAFARAGMPIFALDLRDGTGRDPVPAWFDVPHPMRQIGAVFGGEESMSQPIVLTRHYDGMLFVDRTTRAVPVARGEEASPGPAGE